MNEREILEKLVIKAKKGDIRALEEIYNRFRYLMVKICSRTYIKDHDMDDLMQLAGETLVNAVKKYENRGTGFTSYVRSAIQKKMFYCIRGSMNKPSCCSIYSVNDKGEQFIESFVSEREEDNLETYFIYREKTKCLRKSVEMLPERYKNIIVSYYSNNISLKEYAEKNNMSYRNTVAIKKKALEKLKKIFTKIYK